MLEKDCKFYDKKTNICKALNRVYCAEEREKCAFYKTEPEQIETKEGLKKC